MTGEGVPAERTGRQPDPVLGGDDDLRERAMSKAWEVIGGVLVAVVGLVAVVIAQTQEFASHEVYGWVTGIGIFLMLLGGCSAL